MTGNPFKASVDCTSAGFDPSLVTCYEDLLQYVVRTEGGYQCSCGGFSHRWKMNVQNHLESIHFPGHFCLELRSLRGAGQDEKWTVATQVEVPQQKSLNHLESIQNHMESIHFPGHFVWNCDLCGEQAKTRNGLSQHKSKFHSKKN